MESPEALNSQNSIEFSNQNTQNTKLFASKYFINNLKNKNKSQNEQNINHISNLG